MNMQDILKAPCPDCGASNSISLMSRPETVRVRGLNIEVNATAYVCSNCECEFHGPGASDSIELAHQRFRQIKGLMQPAQMKAWRIGLDLKQSELALLLGWSTATVSRYENGALQDDAHDRSMRAAMTPQGLLALAMVATELPEAVRNKLKTFAKHQTAAADQLDKVVSNRLREMGSPHLQWSKLCETVLFFCEGHGVWRPTLNKLLFYCDFLYAKHFNQTVTGLSYVGSKHGPVPNKYELIFATLQDVGVLQNVETTNGAYIAYQHRSVRKPDLSCFSEAELKVLREVRRKFGTMPAEKLEKLSYDEDASRCTPSGKRVALSRAKSLSISI